ncbi:hypothetical protein NDU88_002740 [Pleurodeles waltl]|uniref:Uncharacterized protein n=1 Tax=Pleurodeles waltl TaxID=8319 RepID=A0AAV7MSJ6_PLEWA|nr:hypothetical protein NDU88_002740 [Pleurodeles waltl]
MRSFAQCQKSNFPTSHQLKARLSRLQLGDSVLLKCQSPGRKLQLPFVRSPSTIVHIRGTKVTVRRGDEEVSRNISHFKKFHGALPPSLELEGAEQSGDPGDIFSPGDSSKVVRPRVIGNAQGGGPDSIEPPSAGGKSVPPVTRGRIEKTHYNLRANSTLSSLLQHHV